MTKASFDDLVLLAGALRRAPFDAGGWRPAMTRMKALTGSSKIAFAILAPRGQRGFLLHGDCTPDFEAAAFDPLLANPFLPYMWNDCAPDIFTDQALLPKNEFRKTAFFNEWLVPQGDHSALIATMPVKIGIAAGLFFNRGGRQPDFDCSQVELLRQLAPTIARAAALHIKLGTARLAHEARSWDAAAIGHILVDAAGRPLALNATAEALLATPDSGLLLSGGRVATTAWPGDMLAAMVAAACSPEASYLPAGGDLLVRSPSTDRPRLALSVSPFVGAAADDLPVARAAILLIQDLAATADAGLAQRCRSLFGLTAKEAELAADLAAGFSVQDYARAQGVSLDTARTHLRNLFTKTSTARQGQLVALLNRVARVPG